ncbi:glutamate--cysteine ligase [Curtobacterium flaccumfaciens pv. poinsettiae]|nr:glutamate--cysteine ligase [Curtobacterium flaccumfaciens pv. poinsettiae]
MSAELTLGAEEELHLIDLESGRLSAKAPRLLPKLPTDRFGAELQRTTIETNTPVVRTLDDLRRVIVDLRSELSAAIAPAGVTIAAVGTAPRSEYADFELSAGGRYGRMQEQYRMLVDEQLICGLQVHVGVSDRDLAVLIAQRVAPVLPVLLALSASSPFWNGQDTGYASFRSIIWQRWPSAGSFGPVEDAAEYDRVLDDLIASGVIADKKMAYFDVRPSSHAPTLELRVCDATPVVDDAVLIAGLFRAAVRKAEKSVVSGAEWHPRSEPLHRAAMWQAARSGLSGELVGLGQHPERLPAEVAVRQLVSRLRPELEELGDWGTVTELLDATLARGNSTDRQRTAYAERGEIDDVVALVVEDTAGLPSGRDEDPVVPLPGYRVRAGDEAVGPGARPRPAFRDLAAFFDGTPRPRSIVAPPATPGPASTRSASWSTAVRRRSAVTWCPGRSARTSGRSSSVAWGSGPARSNCSCATRTAIGGSWPTACWTRTTSSVRRAGTRTPPGCRRPRSVRRCSGSTWCATSSAAGGCSRTTSARPRASRTASPCAS